MSLYLPIFIKTKIQNETAKVSSYPTFALPDMNKSYDLIIAGAGLAGLSLAYRLALDESYNGSVLLIDKDDKTKNDRTWSFWSKDRGLFDELIYHSWPELEYADPDQIKQLELGPYRYHMIRGIDFYKHTLTTIKAAEHIDILVSSISHLKEAENQVEIQTDEGLFHSKYVLKSYPDKFATNEDNFVWQHFKGWIIETHEKSFNPNKAIIMDFRIEQEDQTKFFYVMPTSENRALVELAIFSKEIPSPSHYDSYLDAYIKNELDIGQYSVEEEELGAIPMTSYDFQKTRTRRIIPIGTNGGSVKASSGYAFTRIQNHIETIYRCIINEELEIYKFKRNRYSFYDGIMLNAITSGKVSGAKVFEKLFSKLSAETIFDFLNESGSFMTDLKIFTAPPTLPFLKAFFEEL